MVLCSNNFPSSKNSHSNSATTQAISSTANIHLHRATRFSVGPTTPPFVFVYLLMGLIKFHSGKYTLTIAQQTFHFETHHVLKIAWILVPPCLKYVLIAM